MIAKSSQLTILNRNNNSNKTMLHNRQVHSKAKTSDISFALPGRSE